MDIKGDSGSEGGGRVCEGWVDGVTAVVEAVVAVCWREGDFGAQRRQVGVSGRRLLLVVLSVWVRMGKHDKITL